MSLWHYTTSRTVAADLKVGDWTLSGDECALVVAVTHDSLNGEPTTFYSYAHGDGVSVEYQDAHGNPSEVWDHHYPSDHVVTLIHFKERD